MSTERSKTRTKIIKLVDEMIADLTSVKRTALNMDYQSIRTLGAVHRKRLLLLDTIYAQLATGMKAVSKEPNSPTIL